MFCRQYKHLWTVCTCVGGCFLSIATASAPHVTGGSRSRSCFICSCSQWWHGIIDVFCPQIPPPHTHTCVHVCAHILLISVHGEIHAISLQWTPSEQAIPQHTHTRSVTPQHSMLNKSKGHCFCSNTCTQWYISGEARNWSFKMLDYFCCILYKYQYVNVPLCVLHRLVLLLILLRVVRIHLYQKHQNKSCYHLIIHAFSFKWVTVWGITQ
jgi:hypothetical protein